MLKSLQTHGLFDERWVPPRDGRFVGYDRRDEAWMKPLGLWRTERVPKALFDVRRLDGTLVGFSDMDPTLAGYSFRLPVRSNNILPVWDAARFRLASGFEELEMRTAEYECGGDRFLYWQVQHDGDAATLVRFGWIKLLGEDNIQRFANELEMKHRQDLYVRNTWLTPALTSDQRNKVKRDFEQTYMGLPHEHVNDADFVARMDRQQSRSSAPEYERHDFTPMMKGQS